MNLNLLLADWNPWWERPGYRGVAAGLPRRDLQAVIARCLESDSRRAIVLVGPRQVGKTTILSQCVADLLNDGVDPDGIVFLDLVDARITEEIDLHAWTAQIERERGQPRFLIIDEIGRAPRWDRWLQGAVDRRFAKVLVTDSSASLLHDRGRESGLGRWEEHVLEGVTFREYVRLQGGEGQSFEDVAKRRPTGQLFESFLRVGGFPEHASRLDIEAREAARSLRSDIADRAISRDLAHLGVDTGRVQALLVYVLQESGEILNVSGLASELEGATRKTVSNWVSLLLDTFLIRSLERFDPRPRKKMALQPKIYAFDHSLIAAFTPTSVEDPDTRRRLFEAIVYRELRELIRMHEGLIVEYVRIRNDLEIDFFVHDHGSRRIALEVTASAQVKSRKRQRLIRAADAIGATRRLLVHGGDGSSSADGILQLPIVDFLTRSGELLLGE